MGFFIRHRVKIRTKSTKIRPKFDQNSTKILSKFDQNSTKNPTKNRPKIDQNSTKIGLKCNKMEIKWTQNGRKVNAKCAPGDNLCYPTQVV